MSASIDQLQIDVTAQATKANDAIEKLVGKLERLSTALNKIDGTKLVGLANGVSRLSTSMQSMSNVKTADFTRLATNLQKLGNINTSSLNSAASSMSRLTSAFSGLGAVSANAQSVSDLAKNIAKLGNKSVQTAITNIPQLATAMNNLMTTLSRSPRVSSNVIQMTNALASLASQGARVGSATNGVIGGLNRMRVSANNTSKSFKSLASAFGRFYANYFLIVRALKKLWSSVVSTANYIEAFNYFNVAFDKIASEWNGDWEKYGYENAEAYARSFTDRINESLGKLSGLQIDTESGTLKETGLKNLGLNIQEVTQYASQLASITNSVGQTGEVSLAAASSFTKLAGDISSLFNINYSSVAKNLQSGLIGQSRALYKYGIDITNATLQTYAYELGLEKAVSEMTQAEKMQLRMIVILNQSKASWGDLANTINSPSNMIRQFTNNLKEAGMVLGQLFIPLLERVMPVINGVTIATKRLLTNIAGILGVNINLSSFGQGYTELEDDVDGVSDSLDDATSAAKKFKAVTLGFDELNILSDKDNSDKGTSSSGDSIDLTDEILDATEEYDKIWDSAYDKMESRAQKFAKKIGKYFKPIEKLFSDISIGDWFSVGQDTSNIVIGINDFLARAIENVDWHAIGNNIGNFVAGIEWTKVLSSFGKLFWEAITSAIELWKGSFSAAPIETGVITAIAGLSWLGITPVITQAIATAISPSKIGASITGMVSSLFSSGGIFGAGGFFATASVPVLAVTTSIAALTSGLVAVYATNEEVRKSFEMSLSAIKDGLQPAIEVITGTVLPNLQSGWERLLEILSPLGIFVQDMFVSVWQDMLNPALSYIGEDVLPALSEAFENLWNNILVPLGSFLADVLDPVIAIIADAFTVLWENVVVPLADAIGGVLGTAFEALCDTFNYVIESVQPVIEVLQFLWTNVVSPIIDGLWKELKPAFEIVFETIGGIIDGLGTTLSGVIKFITGIFTGDWKRAWNGVVDIFKGVFNGVGSVVEGVINLVIKGLNKFIAKFDGIVTGFGDVIGIDISIPKIPEIDIPKFAGGGMPNTGELFMARENGINEMVGRIGNHSAVANNDQIVQAIQGGVETAMMNVMMAFTGNMNGNGDVPIIENVFKCDSETMYRMTKKGKEKHDRRYHVSTEF